MGGEGRFAALLIAETSTKTYPAKMLSGHRSNTTSDEMELMAVIVGLEALTRRCEVIIFTKRVNRKNSTLKRLTKKHDVEWRWSSSSFWSYLARRWNETSLISNNGDSLIRPVLDREGDSRGGSRSNG